MRTSITSGRAAAVRPAMSRHSTSSVPVRSAVDIARAACTTSTVPPTSSAGSVASLPSAATPTAWKNVIWRGLSAVNIG